MNTALNRRLARLEAADGVYADFPVIFISFQGRDGSEPHKATLDRHVWHRAPDETGETFQERVGDDVGGADKPWATVVFLE